MKQKFCIPIIKPSQKEVLAVISKYKSKYDYFEIWLDYIQDLDTEFVKSLSKIHKEKLIVLFRRQKLEKPTMDKALKHSILSALDGSETLVDFDIKTQKNDVLYVASQKLKLSLILSYHNYELTPSDKFLNTVLKDMKKYSPAIYKISAFCKTETDAIRLLHILVRLQKEHKQCIILGMGECGIYTRICGMLLGNVFSFAPDNIADASAPGQLTRKELLDISNILSRKFN